MLIARKQVYKVVLYKARQEESMASLRYRIMTEKVLNSTTFVNPERLPPTENSLKFHSYRCHYQILKWKGVEKTTKPDYWGWYISDAKYFLKTSDNAPAPESLLKIIHCDCE